HTRFSRDWSSDVCSSDLKLGEGAPAQRGRGQNAKRTPPAPYLPGSASAPPGRNLPPSLPLRGTKEPSNQAKKGTYADLSTPAGQGPSRLCPPSKLGEGAPAQRGRGQNAKRAPPAPYLPGSTSALPRG